MWASRNGFEHIVVYLLDHDADVNQSNRFGSTALMWAASRGHLNVVKILIDRGADVSKANKDGWTPLMWACWKGHAEIAQTLIQYGADVNQCSKNGRSPLMWASHNGFSPIVKVLIDNGADVNAAINDGQTSLTWAGRMGHVDTVKVLVENGANAVSVLTTLYELVAVISDVKSRSESIAEMLASKYEKVDRPPNPPEANGSTSPKSPRMKDDLASPSSTLSLNEEKNAMEEEKDGEIRVPLSKEEMDNMSVLTTPP
jgi:ankyrin repeat protein